MYVSGFISYFRFSSYYFWGLNATGCKQQVRQSGQLSREEIHIQS